MKTARVDGHFARLDRPPLFDPRVPAAVEHTNIVVAVVTQGPPQAGRELPARMIDGDHMRLVADAPLGHRLGEPSRRRDLHGDRIVGVDDVGRPVDVDRAGDVAGQVFIARTTIVGLLDAGRDLAGRPPIPACRRRAWPGRSGARPATLSRREDPRPWRHSHKVGQAR